MLVNETSRLTQLTPAGLAKFNASMVDAGISIDALVSEVSTRIDGLPVMDAVEGAGWYRNAHRFAEILADEFDTTVEIVSAVISALSQRMPWLRNKSVAHYVFANLSEVAELSAIDAAKAFGKGLYSNFAMAVQIARGEDIANTLSGTKRRSFYNNIVSPDNGDSVTIDTWMVRALMNISTMTLDEGGKFLRKNETALGGTGVGYYALAEACRIVAEEFQLMPCQIQALYWIAVSGSANGGRTDIAK
jgi:hypothetical protein